MLSPLGEPVLINGKCRVRKRYQSFQQCMHSCSNPFGGLSVLVVDHFTAKYTKQFTVNQSAREVFAKKKGH